MKSLNDETVYKEAFVRWQGVRIQQLGTVNNLFVVLGTALIGFELPFLFGQINGFSSAEKYSFLASMAFLFFSVLVGCYTAWNRLQDFRKTASLVRLLWKEPNKKDEIKMLREATKQISECTWSLLRIQAVLFVGGVLFLVMAGSLRLFD